MTNQIANMGAVKLLGVDVRLIALALQLLVVTMHSKSLVSVFAFSSSFACQRCNSHYYLPRSSMQIYNNLYFFQRQSSIATECLHYLYSASSSGTPATSKEVSTSNSGVKLPIVTKLVQTEGEIMDVAILRNNCTSPRQMIQNQLEKRQSLDKVKSVFSGFFIGTAVGIAVGVATYLQSSSLKDASQSGGIVGIIVSIVLAINNYSGNKVYVMTEAEAINRLKVDYTSGLIAEQDIGFTACIDGKKYKGPPLSDRFAATHGVVGCMDCQLWTVHNGVQIFHMKNMFVDPLVRRQGIGLSLIGAAQTYAKQNTNASYLTL